ncbi:MAG: tetratricopeptide (TPR) repeat protein/thiol-disulfide isomerase/thioredoxin [Verrucomicrobiales bacterium]
MAHSPLNAGQLQQGEDYIANWDALGAMITRGRSFSGRERHVAFLNTQGKPFVKVSATTGLDFIDDGRALAVTDWDGDGDLDLWMTQRNGPRVRFVRNDVIKDPNFISASLEGVSCNRDAIGARVILTTSAERTLTRTVRAGDSFLSQSSKSLHFGLLSHESIQTMVVAWPGIDTPETFAIPQTNHHYALKQGSGVAAPRNRKATSHPSLTPSIPNESPSSENVRHVLIHRPDAPTLKYVSFAGEIESFEPESSQGPVLINLWATWCAPCVQELAEFTETHDAFVEKNVKILALSVEAITEDGTKPDLSDAKAFVASAKIPFQLGIIDATTAQILTLARHRTVTRHRPLPLPSSFLIDRHGKIGVIYEGPVSSDQLLKDIDLLEASPKAIETASFPFPGRDGIKLFPLTKLSFAQAYQSGGYIDDARQAIQDHLERATLQELYFLGTLKQSQSQWSEAAASYAKVLEMAPDKPTSRIPLAVALWQSGRQDEAKAQFAEASEQAAHLPSLWTDLGRASLQINQPEEALRYFRKTQNQHHIAAALIKSGQPEEGIALYESLLKKNPEDHQTANKLAWILATHDQTHLRNPQRALELAGHLGTITDHRDPRVLKTLAAAHASAGSFEDALRYAASGRRMARATGMTTLVSELTDQIKSYQ